MSNFQILAGYLFFVVIIFSIFTPFLFKIKGKFFKILYFFLIIFSLLFFIKLKFYTKTTINCFHCPLYSLCFEKPLWLNKLRFDFFYFLYQYTLMALSSFVLGTIFSGFFVIFYRRFPSSILGAIIGGIVFPFSVCGIFPLVKGMLAEKEIKSEVPFLFLFITPLLSPLIIFLSLSLLGVKYLLLRILGTLLLAIVGAFILSRMKEVRKIRKNLYKEVFLKDLLYEKKGGFYFFEYGFYLFRSLLRYIFIGILLGTTLLTFLSPQFIAFIGFSLKGLFFTVLIAFPLHLCNGQDIVLLRPLKELGLPLAHQLGFSFAGSGICLSVIPLYYAVLEKRLAFFITIYYFISSLVISYLLGNFLYLI